LLAGEVMIERALGDAGGIDDGVDVSAAKTGAVDMLKGALEEPFAGAEWITCFGGQTAYRRLRG
jgi:hypothetical protein